MNKKHILFQDNVAETLLIPLWMRAQESKREDAIIRDEVSERLVENIDYDFEKFSADKRSQIGIALRTKYLDKVVGDFISSNQNPVVILGGCGLDPRMERIKAPNPYISYELDLPEVIEIRKQVLEGSAEDRLLPTSLFDTGWMKSLKEKHKDANFLIVVEGVLMYFEESIVRQFFIDVSIYLPNSKIYIERMGVMVSKNTKHHTSVKKTKAAFKWGCDDPNTIVSWHPSIRLNSEYYFMKDAPIRVGFLGLIAKLFFGHSCGIWGYDIDSL